MEASLYSFKRDRHTDWVCRFPEFFRKEGGAEREAEKTSNSKSLVFSLIERRERDRGSKL
jgi:hypothetical protein